LYNLITDILIEGMQPEPDYTVTEHADKYRILPQEGSAEPGQYRSSRTPYLREIMDCLSLFSGVQEVCAMKATQLGLTEAGNNWFCYVVDAAPGPMLMVFPIDNLASDHSKQKLTTTIEETPRLKAKIGKNGDKRAANAVLTKKFPGGILFLCGANSPANYRSKSIRYLFLDDLDGFPATVGKDGCPAALAERRTDSYSSRKKIFKVSTPTIKGISKIEAAYNASDQRKYYVPCPFCGKKQTLEWGGKRKKFGVKFKRDKAGEVIAAWYECKFCHEGIDESHKTQMLEDGKWKARYPKRKKRGYHISSLYSPLGWVSWKQIAEEFLDAKNSPEKLQVWTNTRLAQVWDEEGSQPDWVLLKSRAEHYEIRTVPDPAFILAAGVDVQADRLPFIIRAFGTGEESWLVMAGELYGDPLQPQVWEAVDQLLSASYMHATGMPLYIDSMAIDSGYLSQVVYNFCRQRPIKTIAIKGSKVQGKPIINKPNLVDVTWEGETIKEGCQLWTVGTDTAKAQIYARLAMKKPGPGFYHFPVSIDDEYFLQLTAEKRITKYRNGFPYLEWVKLRERNDFLDCEVYAYAAALRAGMHHCDFDAVRRSKLGEGGATQSESKRRAKPQKRERW